MSKRDEARRLQDVITSMKALHASGLEYVAVVQVLRLADPDWGLTPEDAMARRQGQEEMTKQPVTIDPRADPITGCMPVTAASAPGQRPEA